jgi:alpha-galactosidase
MGGTCPIPETGRGRSLNPFRSARTAAAAFGKPSFPMRLSGACVPGAALLCFVLLPEAAQANRNAVGQTPVMGWSGYNAFMQNSGRCDHAGAGGYNESTFVATMDVLVSSGLRDAGYVYVNADDCWIAENRTADGQLAADPTRFAHGMKWLAQQAHDRELKLGLYAAASITTCRDFPGSQGHERLDALTFADWGGPHPQPEPAPARTASVPLTPTVH